MKSPQKVYFVGLVIGLSLVIFFTLRNCEYSTKLIEIEKSTEINLKVRKAYNERGNYILNDSMFVGFAPLHDFNSTKYQIKDDAIWRPNNAKHLPRLSDIDAPFTIIKKKNSDTILLLKKLDTFTAILK